MRSRMLPILAVCALAGVIPMSANGHERRELGSAEATAMYTFMTEGTTNGLLGFRSAADPQPLEGEGRNMQIVANVPMEGSAAASDLELAGDYAYVGSYGEGMVIVDISNPREPKRVGVFNCPGGQNDVQLQPGSNPQYAVLAIESTSNTCGENKKRNEGFVLIDVSDKANPREIAFVGQSAEEGGVEDGAHNTTMDWPYLYVDQYLPTHGDEGKVDIFDLRRIIADPTDRQPVAILDTPGGGAHDMQVDHRPDGSVLGYAASIGFTDVYDLKDPTKPRILQRLSAAEHGVGVSHGLEPNFDRTLAIEVDEYGGGSGVGACGDRVEQIPLPGSGQVSTATPGSFHLLRLAEDGQIATIGAKVDQVGAYNTPAETTKDDDDGCTAHVFWQAPDENRMVIAWYGRGARIVDFSDPANPVELGFFHAAGGEAWSAKPHKGYIFVGDTVRGLDVLEYTGEDCARWPTTAGAAEVQRARYQGTTPPPESESPRTEPAGCEGPATNQPPVPIENNQDPGPELTDTPNNDPGSSGSGQNQNQGQGQGQGQGQPQGQGQGQPQGQGGREVGGYRFMRVVKAKKGGKAKRATVRLQILAPDGKVVASRKFKIAKGKRVRLRAAIGGPVGRYGFRIRVGKRTVRKGQFSIKTVSKTRVRGATADTVKVAKRR